MENNHLTYFKIENFKKFDSLEVIDIGQFNLIVGGNNVGKTCLLESISLGESPKDLISTLYYILAKRKFYLYNDIEYQISDVDSNFRNNVIGLVQKHLDKPIKIERKKSNSTKSFINEIINKKDFNPRNNQETNDFIEKVQLFNYKRINDLSKNWLIFKDNITSHESSINFLCDITSSYYKDFAFFVNYFPLIKLDDLYSNDLIDFFRRININPNNEELLLNILNSLFPEIQVKRIIVNEAFNKDEFIQISTIEKVDYHSISNYGDGFIKVFRIILELILSKNRFICIDEIDSGIHYSKQKYFWENILKICKELNVQLFATTHSQECTEAFVNSSNILNISNDIRLIKLEESSDKDKIYASTFSYNQISAGLDSNIELRG
jgi:AAA15 family ATPase/GTPase